jgi:hypothetical protein
LTEDGKRTYRREIHAPPERTLAAVDEAAEMWNAVWQISGSGGRLHLPVLAGIRRGSVVGPVKVGVAQAGSTISFEIEDDAYQVNRPALIFLVLGALGGVLSLFWPLLGPDLQKVVPFGLVMAIGAWLLVVSRLRTAGPEDFFDSVAEIAEEGEEPEEPGEPEPPPGAIEP